MALALIHIKNSQHRGTQRCDLPILYLGCFHCREGEGPSEGVSEGGVGRGGLLVLVSGGGSPFCRALFGPGLTAATHESAPNTRFVGRPATWKNWSHQCERSVRMSVSTTTGRLPRALDVGYLSFTQLFDFCPN